MKFYLGVEVSGRGYKWGFGTGAVKLYLELWQRGLFKDIKSALDVGSQELHLDQADFEQIISIAGINDYEKKKFKNLENWPGHPRCSVKHFYEMLGMNEYACIDYNGEHGALPLDLNAPLTDKFFYGKYDLVTDHGCAEHVFNIGEVYRTMHRLCKTQGLILICQAVWGGNGYYLFDLSFFEGLAAANNYKVLFSSYVVDTLSVSGEKKSINQFHIPLSRELLRMIDYTKTASLGISYVLQKQSDDDFKYPYQGNVMSEQYNNYGYQLQFLPVPPNRTYIPVSQSILDVTKTKDLIKYIAKRIAKRLLCLFSIFSNKK